MSERVLIRNEVGKPCKDGGVVHEYLTQRTDDTDRTYCSCRPIAVDPDHRFMETLRKYGEPVPIPEGMVVINWPEPGI